MRGTDVRRGIARVALAAIFSVPSLVHAVTARATVVGDVYRVTTQSSFSGWNEVPAAVAGKSATKVTISGNSKIVFRERALRDPVGEGIRLYRVYDSVEYIRKTDKGNEKAGLRPAVRRVLLDPKQGGYLVYSPDVLLQFPELAMIDEHVHLRELETFLPTGELTAGRSWDASTSAIVELTGVDAVESGRVVCVVSGEIEINGRKFVQISANGRVVARSGPARARCDIRGGVYVDPSTGRFVSIRTIGRQETLGADDRVVSSLDVDYQVLVEPLAEDGDFAAADVSKLPSAPTPEMLQLVFDSPSHGVRFEHARHWLVQSVDPGRIVFAGPDVSFVVTAEADGKTPSTSDYFTQVEKFLKEQKIVANLVRPARESTSDAGRIGNFRYEATLKDRPSILDYWIVERKGRGATIAVNAAKSAAPERLGEVESIARRMSFAKP